MIIYLALLIPVIAGLFMLKYFRKNLVWWEVLIPTVACLLFIVIFKWGVEKAETSDTEYWGSTIVKAQYDEPYETWVHKTCSYTTCSGSGKSRHCTTHHYDCSYCDYHGPQWRVVDNLGQTWSISQTYYNELMARWKSKQIFVELNRNITFHGSCGKDGDRYEITWNGDPMTSDAATSERSYENRIQAAHSAFDFPEVSEEDVKIYKLYDYPEVKGYKQQSILGMEHLNWMKPEDKKKHEILWEYLSGHFGPVKHCKIFFLIFKDMPISAASMQEAYWDGGNDNELVICIGIKGNSTKLEWVKPFSWTPNRKVIVDAREEIMNIGVMDMEQIYTTLYTKVIPTYKRRDFEEFSYVTVDPPTWAIITTYIITLLITVGLCIWAVKNDMEQDPSNPWKTTTTYNNRWKR